MDLGKISIVFLIRCNLPSARRSAGSNDHDPYIDDFLYRWLVKGEES